MRKKREPETDEQRNDRVEQQARERSARASADDQELDAAIKRSIALYGP